MKRAFAVAIASATTLFGVPAARGAAVVTPPPGGVDFDYQLGGASPPPPGVRVLARDRHDPAVAGLYNICYLNAFQTQPEEDAWWKRSHPTLLLRDARRRPIGDPNWPGEYILDFSTAAKRRALIKIMSRWIGECASRGFQGIEFDNLDTFTRYPRRLSQRAAISYTAALIGVAHANGLAVGQKNTVEFLGRRAQLPFDFAITEDCAVYDECGQYAAVYGDRVFDIEYTADGFAKGCAARPAIPTIMRDLLLVPAGERDYLRRTC